MALPKLNNATYELTLPSTGEQVKYRPFLVKEQKALMIAQESEDDKQIETTLALEDIDPYKMPVFDVEYLFLRIRGKSVGEKVTVRLLCPDDEKTRVDVDINLEEVDVQMSNDHTNVIRLTKDISLVMRYPRFEDMSGFDNESQTNSLFDMIKRCVHEIHDGDTIHHRVDMSEKDLETFIESMSTQNLEEVSVFFDTMPKLIHIVKAKNPKTKKKVEIPIEGLQNFFG